MLVGTLVVRDGSNGVEISWNNFQEVQVVVWVPQIWLRIPRKGPKWPKNAQNLILSTLVVQNGWNGVERSWNKLQEPVGIWGGGVPSILAQERPKRPILGQKWPKYNFEHSRDPKRLKQHGAKLERVTGSPG